MTIQITPPQIGILVATTITAGSDGREQNHAEGIVVSTTLNAGAGNGGLATNHAEGLVGQYINSD